MIVPSATSFSSSAACAGETGLSVDALAAAIECAEQLGDDPVGRLLGLGSGFEQRVEPASSLDLGGQNAGIVRRYAELFVALALGVRQLGQAPAAFLEERVIELERQQVGVGEVAIIVRVFLRAQRARDALVGVEQPRFLRDLAAALRSVRPDASPHARRPP